MNDERSPTLERLITEAKDHLDVRAAGDGSKELGPGEIDWTRLEARLMATIEHEQIHRAPPRGRRWPVRAVTALAVAATIAFGVVSYKDSIRTAAPAVVRLPAGSLRLTQPGIDGQPGEVRVAGSVAAPGVVLHGGDSIDVRGARAVFERPDKVTWLVEQDRSTSLRAAFARVTSAGEPLVLGLEHGVIEAQVTPIPVGEAFAVDVATEHGVVRVAVHGTHLRVAREGHRVIVDLTEGVISIGVPPSTGITRGTEVKAPAHVELDATDLGILVIDHSVSAVRAAVPLGKELAVAGHRAEARSVPNEPPRAPLSANTTASGTVGRPTELPTPSPKAVPPPRAAIAAAVRDCAALDARPSNVRVTVTSTLELRVSQAGVVESAQFTPPLLPNIQSCAAAIIYKTKLDESGLVTIPIEYSY